MKHVSLSSCHGFLLMILLTVESITVSFGWILPKVSNNVLSHRQTMTKTFQTTTKTRTRITTQASMTEKNDAEEKVLDVVMKFGGSSIANAERVDHVANIIKERYNEKCCRPRAVICSAMGKTTNNLLNAGEFALDGRICIDAIRTLHTTTMDTFDCPDTTRKEVMQLLDDCEQLLHGVSWIQELSPKTLDQLVSYGERCSVRIMAARLNQIGVPAQAYDAWDIGIITDSNFGDANLLHGEYETLVKEKFNKIDTSSVAIVTGFLGIDPNGKITTLGRGGSDLSATAIGASLNCDEVQVWKDVDGILSCDPRIVSNAITVPYVTYEEAAELAYFGAQVLHPIAMQPAMKYHIPVRVKNSYNPASSGTIINTSRDYSLKQDEAEASANQLVTAITFKRDITVLDIESTQMLGAYGFLARVFGEFEKRKLSVDVLASSEVSVSLTLDKKQDGSDIQKLIEDLKDCADVTRKDNRGILTLITDVERSSEVLSTVFTVFAKENYHVEMMSQGASKVNISFILKSDQLDDAILSLHECFFESKCAVLPYQDTTTAEE